jgi:CPA2 family monovalent cation:H+ antiporter-2
VLIAVMMALGWFLLPSVFAQAARTKSPELFLSASLLIAIVSSLATTAVGLSPIVGALLAGLMIAETPYAEEVEAVTLPFKGLALGVFLITVGMSLNLDLLAANWFKMLLATGTVVFIKSVVTMALLRAGRVQRGLAAETSVLMASPSETTLIVLGAAAAGGLINQNAANFWQVVTAIGMTITPLLARIGHAIARRLDLKDAVNRHPPVEPQERHAILIGYGRVGQMVADMLETHNQPYLVLEADVDQADQGVKAGHPVRFGDASRVRTIEALHPERAAAVVLTMDDPVQNVKLTRWLRERYPDLTIVARARDVDHAAELYRAGASDAVPDTLESSLQLSESVLVDLGVAVGPVIASVHEVRDVLRRRIKQDADLDDAPRLGSVGRSRDA